MSTSKRKRKYSQDFSGNSRTDESFAASCDVNNIVRHYQTTGIDPYQDRIKTARYEEASTMSYEDAMRNKAELDSYIAENPNWQEIASEPGDDPIVPTPAELRPKADDVVDVEPTAPQDASQAKTEAKVQ